STAKVWVRNPTGAICRKDRTMVSFAGSVTRDCESASATVPALNSAGLKAGGLASHPPGSVGRLSRPATVKLLNSPPATDAQCWLGSDAAINGVLPSG